MLISQTFISMSCLDLYSSIKTSLNKMHNWFSLLCLDFNRCDVMSTMKLYKPHMSSTCPHVVLFWRNSEQSWTKAVSIGTWMDLNTVCINGSVWIRRWRLRNSLSHTYTSPELFNIQMTTIHILAEPLTVLPSVNNHVLYTCFDTLTVSVL